MAYSNNKISKPVSIGDVKQAISSASNDLGTLCRSDNINKWAKFKPTRAIGMQTPVDYWKGRANDNPQCCALSQPIASNITTFMQTLASDGYAWTYLRPRGQSQEPKEWYRLMDFDGYVSDAICPLPSPPSGKVAYQRMHTFICGLPYQNFGGLSLSDLYLSQISGEPKLNTCYIGLLLHQGNARHWCTATQTIIEGIATAEQKHLHIAMNLTGMTGVWEARTFLSTEQLTQDQISGGYCIACEGVGDLDLVHTSGEYSVSIEAKWLSNSQYKITAHFTNGKSATVACTDMKITVQLSLDTRIINIHSQKIELGEDYVYQETFNYLFTAGSTATVTANFEGEIKTATTDFV